MRVAFAAAPARSNLSLLVASAAFTTNVVVSERFLLVSVSAVARPTSVSVDVGRVSVPVLTMDENDGVVSDGDVIDGDVPNTSAPVPVSSEITPRNCADVVEAN